jgi:GNAT superfamily N-acetyltransferase
VQPRVTTARERPDLADLADDLTADVFPEWNKQGDVLRRHWDSLYDVLPELQLVLYDPETEEVLGRGNTAPCSWDRTPEGLPDAIEQAFAPNAPAPDALCAMLAVVVPGHQGRGLSSAIIRGMLGLATERGWTDLIAPVRPSRKERYPLTPIERYVRWTGADGLPFDPWIRIHHRLGADVLRTAPRSLRITGSVAEWERWTEMAFPESGEYVIPGGLAPLTIDREDDLGRYWEPNVWMRHRADRTPPSQG